MTLSKMIELLHTILRKLFGLTFFNFRDSQFVHKEDLTLSLVKNRILLTSREGFTAKMETWSPKIVNKFSSFV
jgi:hypothetical protein